MANFHIFRENPARFREQILRFWEEYLPGTPPGRLDWLEHNPAGPTIWLFAVEEKTGELAGTISLFPKDLFFGGKKIKAAILGDYMLHSKYRVFGPALSLLKAARDCREQENFDFLYTIPNAQSKKIIEKVGFRSAGSLYTLMYPRHFDFLLKKYTGARMAKILEKPLLFTLKLFSQATYAGFKGRYETIDWQNEAFDEFCHRVLASHSQCMTGEYSLPYMDWRYRQNPEYNFQLITSRRHPDGGLQGFFVVSENNHRLELYDLVTFRGESDKAMIKKIVAIAEQINCRGIYCMVNQNNPLLAILKKCCFFDTKDHAELFTYPENVEALQYWCFTSADRNI
jgi:RimJ/RimL family protein N-acetyltransferase